MAGTLTTPTRNALLDSLNIKTIKLHSADPTESGTAAVISGAQKDITVGAASGGAIQSTGTVDIDVTVTSTPVTVSHYSLWDGSSSPKCVATGSLSAAQTYTASGKYIVNSLTIDLNK